MEKPRLSSFPEAMWDSAREESVRCRAGPGTRLGITEEEPWGGPDVLLNLSKAQFLYLNNGASAPPSWEPSFPVCAQEKWTRILKIRVSDAVGFRELCSDSSKHVLEYRQKPGVVNLLI